MQIVTTRNPARPRLGSAGIALLVAAGLLGWPGGAAVLAGEEVLVDGVPHIRNGAVASEGVETLELVERWRVGGDDDDVFFGSIAQVLADVEGNIYVMDSQLAQVAVYSPDGELLRFLGGEGEGPGEISRPGDMFFHPDGTLGMVQGFPGKVVKVDLEGNPAGSMNISDGETGQGRFGVLVSGLARGGNLVMCGFYMAFSQQGGMDQTFYLSRCDEQGVELHRYLSKSYFINYGDFVLEEQGIDFVWSGRVTLGPDGRVYAAPERNRYAIHVYLPDGTLEHVIEREYKSRQRDEADKQQARLTLEAVGHNYPVPPRDVSVLEADADIQGLQVTADGELWVTSSRDVAELPDGMLSQFDVFDGQGHLLRKLQVRSAGDPLRDALYLLNASQAVVVTDALDAFRSMQGVSGGDDGDDGEVAPIEIVCYEIAD